MNVETYAGVRVGRVEMHEKELTAFDLAARIPNFNVIFHGGSLMDPDEKVWDKKPLFALNVDFG